MEHPELHASLSHLFSEIADGAPEGGAFILNAGDLGLIRSLDRLSPDAASTSADGGATIAAHADHVRYGLSLMNRWARDGGNPFADATWNEAWKIGAVDAAKWQRIRDGLREEAARWREVLAGPRDVGGIELTGMIASVAHIAYHLGAIRQIHAQTRGPREGVSTHG